MGGLFSVPGSVFDPVTESDLQETYHGQQEG